MKDNNNEYSIFEKIKHRGFTGQEQWSARELYRIIGYRSWNRFKAPLNKAMIEIINNDFNLEDHFTRIIRADQDDYALSKYACYLITKHSNQQNQQVINAQTYFALLIWQNYKRHNSEGSITI